MKLIIVAGFLGSGKTTLLLKLVRQLTARDAGQIVIVENEVGAVAIDNQYLSMQGLQVRELYAGCICCTLATDLVSTLRQLAEAVRPALVFVEPSGIARPDDLANTVRRYAREVSEVRVLGLLDATRYEMLREVLEPLLEATVATSDLLLVNKVDLCTPEELAAVEADVRAMRSDVPLLAISALDEGQIGAVADRL